MTFLILIVAITAVVFLGLFLLRNRLKNTWKNRAHVVMAFPAFLVLLLMAYIPMTGLILAFKTYDFTAGSFYTMPWADPIFKNFKVLSASKQLFYTMTKNTVMYYLLFTIIGTFLNIVLAIAIDQFVFKRVAKTMQTIMIIPIFVSYAAVTFIVYAFLSPDTGIVNQVLGLHTEYYKSSGVDYWPTILTVVKMWNSVGYGSVLYMSVLAGIDTGLYEAAQIDGAGKWKQIWHITLPSLIPMITVMLLLSVGGIMKSDTGLFYQVTRDIGGLYPKTQVIDSYILGQIRSKPNWGFTSAATFFQSIVGLLMMLGANGLVRKIAPENALF